MIRAYLFLVQWNPLYGHPLKWTIVTCNILIYPRYEISTEWVALTGILSFLRQQTRASLFKISLVFRPNWCSAFCGTVGKVNQIICVIHNHMTVVSVGTLCNNHIVVCWRAFWVYEHMYAYIWIYQSTIWWLHNVSGWFRWYSVRWIMEEIFLISTGFIWLLVLQFCTVPVARGMFYYFVVKFLMTPPCTSDSKSVDLHSVAFWILRRQTSR